MTLPPVIRIFFAIELPTEAKDKLSSFISAIKKKSKGASIRWTREENLHITLQFLPEVKVEDLGVLVKNVRNKLSEILEQAKLSIGNLSLFPNPYRPRVIVLDVSPQEHLTKLAQLIGEGILKASYPIDERPFKGHLTLGRIKNPHETDLAFLNDVVLPILDQIEFTEIVLFRSEPQPQGSRYSVLERIAIPDKGKNEYNQAANTK